MYYSSGNYEAFARPRKPAGIDNKTAWFVGSGLASLAGAAFLIRDGRMPGNKITILERLKLPGGALDGIKEPKKGSVIRGGREMEDHFECLWDLFRSIPSIENEGASVLDEFYWLNKDDLNSSLQRAAVNRGQDAETNGLFALTRVGWASAVTGARLPAKPDIRLLPYPAPRSCGPCQWYPPTANPLASGHGNVDEGRACCRAVRFRPG